MTRTWGRIEGAGTWPNRKPVWSLAALLLASTASVLVAQYRYEFVFTPVQRTFLSTYLKSAFAARLSPKPAGRYRLLAVMDRQGSHVAVDDSEIVPVEQGRGTAWAITDDARAAGDLDVAWTDMTYDHAKLNAILRRSTYADLGLIDLAMPSLWCFGAMSAIGLVIAIPKDVARSRARRHGRRLKGPELVTVRAFNRRTRATGIGWNQPEEGLSFPRRRRRMLRIPRLAESSHLLIVGDSGTGKSVMIRQLLEQIARRGDTAIVYDPALEYTPTFCTPARGDIVLNPLDARSPYWSPSDELRHDAEALTIATSLFPDRPNENPFFTEGPRRLFAHLLTQRLSPQQLAAVLADGDELDRRVAGTSYAPIIDRHAPAQRSGVLASLNMVADTLQLLPTVGDATGRWSASDWSAHRRGWLFFTSTPETRPRLVPLTSLWLDLLVLRLMNQGQPGERPVWFILDELASLQRLPQLHTAITENRKSNNPVVLGFQGRSQLETRYGHDAEAMLSQPATKIFLRTSEARAAKWISETIGEIEVERLHESRSLGQNRQQSYGLERLVEPLVMPSEISGLPNLCGYLKLGNLVVHLRVPYAPPATRQARFVERSGAQAAASVVRMPLPVSSGQPAHAIAQVPTDSREVRANSERVIMPAGGEAPVPEQTRQTFG